MKGNRGHTGKQRLHQAGSMSIPADLTCDNVDRFLICSAHQDMDS